MKFLYHILLLYPYIIIKTIMHCISWYFKSIFCFSINMKAIDTMSGVEFEMLILKLLKKSGYKHVSMTKASGDYGIDLLGEDHYLHCGFQCKRYSKNVGVEAIQQAKAGMLFYHLDEVSVITNTYFTTSARQLASINNIILIDRMQLIRMLKNAHMMSSGIPLFTYSTTIMLSAGCFYLYFTYDILYAFYAFICFFVLIVFMILKTIWYKKQNHEEYYEIHEYDA